MYYATLLPKLKTQMKWTKAHSKNAVEAKRRLRIARALVDPVESPTGKCHKPRKLKPDFIIRIESKRGERVQVSAWRLYDRVMLSDGYKSVRQLCRGIEHLITKSA